MVLFCAWLQVGEIRRLSPIAARKTVELGNSFETDVVTLGASQSDDGDERSLICAREVRDRASAKYTQVHITGQVCMVGQDGFAGADPPVMYMVGPRSQARLTHPAGCWEYYPLRSLRVLG